MIDRFFLHTMFAKLKNRRYKVSENRDFIDWTKSSCYNVVMKKK